MNYKIELTREELTTILQVATGNVKDFVMDNDKFINEQLEAINYTRCSAQLKDKKTITINKWTEDNGYKHSFTDCYIKGDDWFTGKQMWQKYNEAMKSL